MITTELGRLGQKRYMGIFFEEFLKELRGKRGIATYSEMADNDSVIGAILFAIEMLIRQCDFRIEPAGELEVDRQAAEFVDSCLHDMESGWQDTLSEILSFLTYGWSYHEINYKFRPDGLIGWRNLPIRSQDSLFEWRYRDDNSDELLGLVQSAPPYYDQVFIPLEKALLFRTTSRKGNPEGKSILRSSYRSWYFKKRIEELEGIGLERTLAGLPVLTASEGVNIWDGTDPDMENLRDMAEEMVANIRSDNTHGLVLPNGWELKLLSTESRQNLNTSLVIERYNKLIASSVLADFILMGQQAVGSFALASEKTRLFALAVGTYLDIICGVFNSQAIPRLFKLNEDRFAGISGLPILKHGDIEDIPMNELGDYIRNLVGVGALVPDLELENSLRAAAHLPAREAGGLDEL